jgi:hypothetical protein
MRYVLVLVLAALLGLGFVLHERKTELEHTLGAVATQLAGRPVKVHCQGVAGDLIDVTPEWGSVQFNAGVPSDTTNLKRSACTALKRLRGDARSSRLDCVLADRECDRRAFEDVRAVNTLAHESGHLRGIRDEALTECRAMQTIAETAMLLGADAQHGEALARYYWAHDYPHISSDYRTASCYNDGPLDVRPADPNWP